MLNISHPNFELLGIPSQLESIHTICTPHQHHRIGFGDLGEITSCNSLLVEKLVEIVSFESI